MTFLRALADATPLSTLVAVVAFVAARGSGALSPLLLGPLAGVAVLVGGTGLSFALQTEDRRYPLTWAALELLSLW